jgi:hypothetical protein
MVKDRRDTYPGLGIRTATRATDNISRRRSREVPDYEAGYSMSSDTPGRCLERFILTAKRNDRLPFIFMVGARRPGTTIRGPSVVALSRDTPGQAPGGKDGRDKVALGRPDTRRRVDPWGPAMTFNHG